MSDSEYIPSDLSDFSDFSDWSGEVDIQMVDSDEDSNDLGSDTEYIPPTLRPAQQEPNEAEEDRLIIQNVLHILRRDRRREVELEDIPDDENDLIINLGPGSDQVPARDFEEEEGEVEEEEEEGEMEEEEEEVLTEERQHLVTLQEATAERLRRIMDNAMDEFFREE